MLMVNQLAGFGVGGGGSTPAEYIGATAGTSSSLTFHANAAEGDLALVCGAAYISNTLGLSGWNSFSSFLVESSSSVDMFEFWKVLTAGDVSSPPTFSPWDATYAHWTCVVFRNVTSAARSRTIALTNTITLTGITKAAATKAIVSHAVDRNNSASPAVSSPLVKRASITRNSISSGHVATCLAEDYTGQNVSWTSIASPYQGGGSIIELS